MCPEEIRQQLWEFHFDLLPPKEAESLRARITSDPAVARAYAEARLRADLVALAARHEEPKLSLGTSVKADEPFELEPENSQPVAQPSAAPDGKNGGRSLVRIVNLLATLAALLLVAFAGFGYVRYGAPWAIAAGNAQREALARRFVRTVVLGPGVVDPAADNSFSVNTASIDGTPVSTDLNYLVLAENGEVRFDKHEQTDDNGWANIVVPGNVVDGQASLRVATTSEVPEDNVWAERFAHTTTFNVAATTASPKWYLARGFEAYGLAVSDQMLAIQPENPVDAYAPGDEVTLNFQISTAGGEPLPADLRVAVVEESVLQLGDVAEPRDEASAGLDKKQDEHVRENQWEEPVVLSDASLSAVEPLLLDNTSQVQSAYQQALAEFDGRRAERLRQVGLVILVGGGVLVAMLLLLAIFRLVSRFGGDIRFSMGRAISSAGVLAAAVCCVLVGGMWTSAEIDAQGELTTAGFFKGLGVPPAATDHLVAKNHTTPLRSSFQQATPDGETHVPESAPEPAAAEAPAPTPSGLAAPAPAPAEFTPKPADPAGAEPDALMNDEPAAIVLSPKSAPAGEGAPGNTVTSTIESKRAGGFGGGLGGGGGAGIAPGAPGGLGRAVSRSGGPAAGGFGGSPSGALGGPGGFGGVMGGGLGGLGGPGQASNLAMFAKGVEAAVPTVYSNGQVVSGKDGRSSVTFKLPKTPGTYRVYVEGRSGEHLGLYRGKFEVKEPEPEK